MPSRSSRRTTEDDVINRGNQLNPDHVAYHQSRGRDELPDDPQARRESVDKPTA